MGMCSKMRPDCRCSLPVWTSTDSVCAVTVLCVNRRAAQGVGVTTPLAAR